MKKAINEFVYLIENSKNAVAFTGAGISQESGIPTFRDPGGIWDRFDPTEVGTPSGILHIARKRPEILRDILQHLIETFERARANPAHLCLSYLEEKKLLKAVITQNVDDLHQEAGSKNVIELHGNIYRFRCIVCGYREKFKKEYIISKIKKILQISQFSFEKILKELPQCPKCAGIMRPDVVLFGEQVQMLDESYRHTGNSDLFIIIGTSGTVYPAGFLPRIAKEKNAKIVEVNPNGPFFGDIVDVFIKSPAGKAFSEVMSLFQQKSS